MAELRPTWLVTLSLDSQGSGIAAPFFHNPPRLRNRMRIAEVTLLGPFSQVSAMSRNTKCNSM